MELYIDSGLCVFIDKMLDKVPSSFKDDQISVLFFHTILNNLSRLALLWGSTSTITAIWGRILRRLIDVFGSLIFAM